jgi:hypothetical protein
MTAQKKKAAARDKVALYEKLIATIPKLERKGDANPYTSLNGNMFALLHQSSSLAIRLPEDKREEFLKKHKTSGTDLRGPSTSRRCFGRRGQCRSAPLRMTAFVFESR